MSEIKAETVRKKEEKYEIRQRAGLWLGLAVFILLLILPPPENIQPEGWATAAVGALMAIWWITEAIPIPVTSLLPLVLLPVLGIVSINEAAAPYANPLIFLFMGGFMIAIAMQRWNLHRRIALNIVNFVGVQPSSIIIGFMIASAFLSMWVSNTATTLMMLPIGLSIIHLARENTPPEMLPRFRNFGIALVLCIAYGCNIGGMGTIIGTPPNAVLTGFMSEAYGFEIGFAQWMLFGVPLVILSLPLAYLVLTRITFPVTLQELPGGREIIDKEIRMLGPMSKPETGVAIVFGITAMLWIFRPRLSDFLPGLSDAGIAIAAAVALFLIPVDMKKNIFLLSWKAVKEKLPWGILVLFGGGLSLANAITVTGFAEWIGLNVGALSNWPVILLLVAIVAMIIFLTEITSNTATAAAFLPILAAVAIGLGQNPLLFVIPAALAASCAFMLPVATPPNAIVFSSGLFSIPEMARAGIWLNVLFIIVITFFAYVITGVVFEMELNKLPDWIR